MAGFKKTGLYDGASSEWDESKHPRDEKGQFTTKAGTVNENATINIQLFASNIDKMGERQLYKSLKSLREKIIEHKNFINNPQLKYSDWESFSEERKNRAIKHWDNEIKAFEYTIEEINSKLSQRSKK